MNPTINYGFGVKTTCHCRFINCNKCTPLVENIVMEEVMDVWGQEVYRKSLYLLRNFAVNIKVL